MTTPSPSPSARHSRSRRWVLWALVYFVLILILVGTIFARTLTRVLKAVDMSYTDLMTPLSTSATHPTKTNILLLGIGGGDHEGPNLTDTITLGSYDQTHNTLKTLSLPRDLWDDNTKDKVNSTYTYALEQRPQAPFAYVKEKYKDLTGVDIDYVVVVDFQTFADVIDLLGGIEIDNPIGFVDDTFPITGKENEECEPYDPNYGCRYETVSFPPGTLSLNGTVALKYVRSRHAVGDEGTDFARSQRQQLVIQAIIGRIKRLITERDITTIEKLATLLHTSVKRDIPNAQAFALIKQVYFSKQSLTLSQQTFSLETFELPTDPKYENRYVLVPPQEDYESFKTDIRKKLE